MLVCAVAGVRGTVYATLTRSRPYGLQRRQSPPQIQRRPVCARNPVPVVPAGSTAGVVPYVRRASTRSTQPPKPRRERRQNGQPKEALPRPKRSNAQRVRNNAFFPPRRRATFATRATQPKQRASTQRDVQARPRARRPRNCSEYVTSTRGSTTVAASSMDE